MNSRAYLWTATLAFSALSCDGADSQASSGSGSGAATGTPGGGAISSGGAPVLGGSGSVGVGGIGGMPLGGATSSGGVPSTGTGGDGSGGAEAGAPGSGGASAGGSTGSGGSAGAGDASPGSGGASGTDTGVLPPVTDPGNPGPFTPTSTSNTGPGGTYMTFAPTELGQGGLKHPIVAWGNGATVTSPTVYNTVIQHMASHGFAVIAYNTTPQGAQMTAAIDWMIAENTRAGSPFEGKLDTTRIAAMGHSAGSLATFQIASDARLGTTLHLNGGTFDPHTDNQNLRKPAIFICGDAGGDGLVTGDVARPNCDIDFQDATTPVWYGDIIGASHLTIVGAATDPKVKAYLTAIAAWLRWQIAGDQTMAHYFKGAACDLCTQPQLWKAQQKNL